MSNSGENIATYTLTKYSKKNTIKKAPTPSKSFNNLKSLENNLNPQKGINESHFKIIDEKLRENLRELAPDFYYNYRRKLLNKILKEGKTIIKPASPGKSKTLKGKNAIPKYPKRLALIRDAYLSDKSPQELYDWWSGKLDKYGMAAKDWHFTWPEIECGFYNQITHLSNSFNKYPPHGGAEGQHELQALAEYLKLVEQIVQTTNMVPEKPNYILIMEAQIAYIRLTQIRHTGNEYCNSIPYFEELISLTKGKPIILLPQSIFGNVKDFVKFYSIPVVPFLSVYKIVHSGIISDPCSQIRHDLQFHSDKYIRTDLLTLDYTNSSIKTEFQKRTKIIEKIINDTSVINGIKLSKIFFDDTHEDEFMFYKQIITQQNNIKLSPYWYKELRQMYELFAAKPGNYLNVKLLSARNKESLGNQDLYEKYILMIGTILY